MSEEYRATRGDRNKLDLDDKTFFDLSTKIRNAYELLDGALSHTLRLNADMVDTAQRIGLEPETGQKLFAEFSDCLGTLMDSRHKMLAAHTRATSIRMRTNQAERGFGCWELPSGHDDGKQISLRAVS